MGEQVREPPWYESNVFWGPLGLAAAIIFTVVATMKHDLRWLLWFAWPCFGLPIWWAVKALTRGTKNAVIWTVVAVLFCGLLLFGLAQWLKPAKQIRAAQTASQTPSAATGAIIQKNSGGINVQQGTTGDNSSIINSPITIGDLPVPPRRISREKRKQLIAILSAHPGTIKLCFASQDSEAHTFALDWYSLFHDSNWSIQSSVDAVIGGPEANHRGVVLQANNLHTEAGKIHVPNNTPSGALAEALQLMKVKGLAGETALSMGDGYVVMTIGAHP